MTDRNIRTPDDPKPDQSHRDGRAPRRRGRADDPETGISAFKVPTPRQIIEAFKENARLMQAARERQKLVRDIRRRTLVCERPTGPNGSILPGLEGAAPPYTDPVRDTIELDLTNAFATNPPAYERSPIGTSDSAHEDAEQVAYWVKEMARNKKAGVPFRAFIGKGTEDAEYMRVRLPSPADALHIPDYFDVIIRGEHKRLPHKKQKDYEPYKPKPGKLVRMEEYDSADGSRKKRQAKNPAYDRDARGRAPSSKYYKTPDPKTGKTPTFERDEKKSKAAHDEAVLHYLAEHPPMVSRVISALDVAPGFKRGTGIERFELSNAVVRTLMTPRELERAGYGWAQMGDKGMAPRAYDANRLRMDGKGDSKYLYEYFGEEYDEDGICHPFVCYTVGGAATWDDRSGDPDDKDSVKCVDFYEEYGITEPLWSYHWGMGNEDDDPAERSRPVLYTIKDALLNFEDLVTTHLAATRMIAFTGHVQIPDTNLSPAALMDGTTNTIRKPTIPQPGEVTTAYGAVQPWNQATVGPDARYMEEMMLSTVRDATRDPSESIGGDASGHSKVLDVQLYNKAKAQIRGGALEACKRDVEDMLRIACAFARKHGVDLAVYTEGEQPAGEGSGDRTAKEALVLDERWVGNHYGMVAEYPDEGNLAEVSLEMDAADRGYSHFENVCKKKGIADANTEMLKVLKWGVLTGSRPLPPGMEERLAAFRNDKVTLEKLRLQNQQQLTAMPVQGMPNGLPTAAMADVPVPIAPNIAANGPVLGTQVGGTADQIRGGIVAGQIGQAAIQSDALGQIAVGG